MQSLSNIPNPRPEFKDYAVIGDIKRDSDPKEERKFEILDFSNGNFSKEETLVVSPPNKTSKKRRAKSAQKEKESEMEEETKEENLVESQQVIFKTDVLETEISVFYVHRDENVVCLFYSSNSKTKVKPKKGSKFTVEIDGDPVEVYSPGVYVTYPDRELEVAFFLVLPESLE